MSHLLSNPHVICLDVSSTEWIRASRQADNPTQQGLNRHISLKKQDVLAQGTDDAAIQMQIHNDDATRPTSACLSTGDVAM